MNTNNQSFSDDLNKLITYFKQIRENLQNNPQNPVDKTFLQNIDLMISNYENIKGSVPPDMLNVMGEPIHKLMTALMDQLKSEYGDVEQFSRVSTEKIQPAIEEKLLPETGIDLQAEIKKIDDWLLTPNLDSSEMDRLLDKRMELTSKLNHQNQLHDTDGN